MLPRSNLLPQDTERQIYYLCFDLLEDLLEKLFFGIFAQQKIPEIRLYFENFYGAVRQIRTADLILTKGEGYARKKTMACNQDLLGYGFPWPFLFAFYRFWFSRKTVMACCKRSTDS